MKKFELTGEQKHCCGITLFRIKALKSFSDVVVGQTGGWVEKEENLSQDGDAWVSGNAVVKDNAVVKGDAYISGNAVVKGDAWISGNAVVSGRAYISGDAFIKDEAVVSGRAVVKGDAWIIGNAVVSYNTDYALISGFGTEFRTTTFFRCDDDNIRVSCGCFFGTIPQFIEQVKNTRSGKIAEEYLAIAELMEKHFEKGDSDDTSI